MTNTLYTSAGYGRLRILHWKCSGLSDVNEVETLNDGHDCSLRRKSGWDVSLRRKMGLLLSTSIKDLLDGTTWYPDSKKMFVCLQSLWVVALLSSSHWSTHDIRVGVKRHFSSLVLWLKHTAHPFDARGSINQKKWNHVKPWTILLWTNHSASARFPSHSQLFFQ